MSRSWRSDARPGAVCHSRAGPARLVARGAPRSSTSSAQQRGAADRRAPAAERLVRVKAPARGGARGRARGKRGLRGLARARGRCSDGSAGSATGRPAPTAAGAAGGDDQHDRPRLAARRRRSASRRLQGYNAQAAVNEQQIVRRRRGDASTRPTSGTSSRWSRRPSRAGAAPASASRRGRRRRRRLLAQAADGERRLPRHPGADPARLRPAQERPPRLGRAGSTRSCAACSQPTTARRLYRKRQATVEPVFGQMKFNRRPRPLLTPRASRPCSSEWRLFGASHNLLKPALHDVGGTRVVSSHSDKGSQARTFCPQ